MEVPAVEVGAVDRGPDVEMRHERRDDPLELMEVGAVLADELGAHGIRPTTGGTDTHLSLHDLQGVGVTGVDAEARADAAGITLNKNAIPFDPNPPLKPSARIMANSAMRSGKRSQRATT